MKKMPFIAIGASLVVASMTARAALTSVDGGLMVSDSTLNLTWANTVGTILTWNPSGGSGTAQGWVSGLNAENYGGYNDWTLPTCDGAFTTGAAFGLAGLGASTSVSENQLVYLFINELGNTSGGEVANLGPFTALSNNAVYWSASPFPNTPGSAWVFSTYIGEENGDNDYGDFYDAMAVRVGQTPAVPLPAAVWLLLSGLGGITIAAHRKAG